MYLKPAGWSLSPDGLPFWSFAFGTFAVSCRRSVVGCLPFPFPFLFSSRLKLHESPFRTLSFGEPSKATSLFAFAAATFAMYLYFCDPPRKILTSILKKPSVYDTQKKNFCVQLARLPVFHQGGLLGLVGGVVWWGVRMEAKISRFFLLSRPSFCLCFFQFPMSFVELRWSLRVFTIDSVFTTHIWPAARLKRRGLMKTRRDQRKTSGKKSRERKKKREIWDGPGYWCPGQGCLKQGGPRHQNCITKVFFCVWCTEGFFRVGCLPFTEAP